MIKLVEWCKGKAENRQKYGLLVTWMLHNFVFFSFDIGFRQRLHHFVAFACFNTLNSHCLVMMAFTASLISDVKSVKENVDKSSLVWHIFQLNSTESYHECMTNGIINSEFFRFIKFFSETCHKIQRNSHGVHWNLWSIWSDQNDICTWIHPPCVQWTVVVQCSVAFLIHALLTICIYFYIDLYFVRQIRSQWNANVAGAL